MSHQTSILLLLIRSGDVSTNPDTLEIKRNYTSKNRCSRCGKCVTARSRAIFCLVYIKPKYSSRLRTPTSLTRVNICGQLVETSPVIRDLGFNVDANLTMTSQVANVCRSAYYHLSRIAKIRDSTSTTVCKSLIHGLVTSRLDYGNAILYGISDRHMHRLEMVQRSAARIVRQIRRGDRQSMTTILRQLHWLPVRKRIDFKLLVLVHRAIYNGTPEYLAALLRRHTPPRSLRSAGGLLLEVPRVNLERFGRRAFACAGPTPWNKLPRNIRDNSNITQFKMQLKTLLFST